MYENAKKEVKEAFKKDEYGKKVNKHMLIGAILFLISLVISVILSFVIDGSLTIDYFDNNTISINLNWICYLFYLITLIFVLVLVYLDGKRDGAIKQFEENYNKKK